MACRRKHSNSWAKTVEDMYLDSSMNVGMTELILRVDIKANAFQYQSQETFQIQVSGEE